jgi:hypothetical protein
MWRLGGEQQASRIAEHIVSWRRQTEGEVPPIEAFWLTKEAALEASAARVAVAAEGGFNTTRQLALCIQVCGN